MVSASVLQIVFLRVGNGVVPAAAAVLPPDAVFVDVERKRTGIAMLFRQESSSFLFALAFAVSKVGAITSPFSVL